MPRREIIIKDTHRGLWYEDGVLTQIVDAGRYVIPDALVNFGPFRKPKVEVTFVDMRERDLTIKGQEILTADKVAIRVSIIVQFRVVDPKAALHNVAKYEDRLYSDVQLAARRSLASMNLEEILTNRNKLSEEILEEVKESAGSYGVEIIRAAVKDLIFPGNLQEIMNRVLAAERKAEAELIDAQSQAERAAVQARSEAELRKVDSESRAEARSRMATSEAEAQRIRTQAEVEAINARKEAAQAYSAYPSLLRLKELETLQALSAAANARIFIGFDKHLRLEDLSATEK
jgi:regulator of protease activity HflC (stomatin/prohibitin superfamily)